MSEYVTDLYEDSYPEDDYPKYDTWNCAKCGTEYVDPEDMTLPTREPKQLRLYWLSVTEPLCEDCATQAGIPALDED